MTTDQAVEYIETWVNNNNKPLEALAPTDKQVAETWEVWSGAPSSGNMVMCIVPDKMQADLIAQSLNKPVKSELGRHLARFSRLVRELESLRIVKNVAANAYISSTAEIAIKEKEIELKECESDMFQLSR